jgi:putative transposase
LFSQTAGTNHQAAVGHLFQGRYKAILCDRDAYLLELKTPQDPWKYRWSSHRAYLGENSPLKIQAQAVLEQFGSKIRVARSGYLDFMKQGICQGHLDRFYQTVEQRFLGEESLSTKLRAQKGKGSGNDQG